MVAAGDDDKLFILHFIDQALGLVDPARPAAAQAVFQASGLPIPSNGLPCASLLSPQYH
jgi:hypothetical protein